MVWARSPIQIQANNFDGDLQEWKVNLSLFGVRRCDESWHVHATLYLSGLHPRREPASRAVSRVFCDKGDFAQSCFKGGMKHIVHRSASQLSEHVRKLASSFPRTLTT